MIKKITHFENEKIKYRGKIYNPYYNLKEAEKYFVKIISKFKNKKKKKEYYYNNINCLNIVYQDLFWQYCSNYIKYSNLIKKIGIFKTIDDPKEKYLFAGYKRIQKFRL